METDGAVYYIVDILVRLVYENKYVCIQGCYAYDIKGDENYKKKNTVSNLNLKCRSIKISWKMLNKYHYSFTSGMWQC